MKLFDVFVRESANRVFIGLVSGIITGVTFSLLIPLVLVALDMPPAELVSKVEPASWGFLQVTNPVLAAAFFGTCVFIISLKTFSQSLMASVAIDAACNLRLDIYRRINSAPIARLENVGNSKLLSIITGDIPKIITGVSAIPDLLISLMTVIGVLTFLAFIHLEAFLFILGAIVFGLVTYQLPLLIGQRYYTESRPIHDNLHESIRGILFGAKELKLNETKRSSFFKEELWTLEQDIKKKEKTGFIFMQAANNYGDLISFLVIGIMVFIMSNYIVMSNAQLFGVVMALIYMISPIHAVLQCLPLIAVGNVSLRRLNWLLGVMEQEHFISAAKERPQWNHIALKDVCYDYTHHDQKAQSDQHDDFHLGPINLTINKGEVTFIVGGNGSGKSTLSKMLTQHYLPSKGEIYFDDVVVNKNNRNTYRHEISSIYSDYHLFKRILGHDDQEVAEIVAQYLSDLGLEDKVSVTDGKFSTIALSDGQKRRLSLLVALLEDRDLYLFDEWAADQDPSFKHIFYHHYLSQLKSQGKAVVVITHDDRYFDLADNVVWMESGNITQVTHPGKEVSKGINKQQVVVDKQQAVPAVDADESL